MKKSVIYTRVSTSIQDQTSQINDLKDWAKKNGYEVVNTFGEEVSGYDPDADRKKLEDLKSYVVKNNIKTVLIWEMSRLGRSTLKTLQHIEFFTQHDINVIFKKDKLETLSGNDINNVVITLLSSIAEMERNTIVSRTKRGMTEAAKQGKSTGYIMLPLGYSKDDNGYLIINEEEVPVVRDIFLKASGGMSARGIAEYLNAKGVPSRSKVHGKKATRLDGKTYDILWTSKSIKNTIKATRYKGYRTYGGEPVPMPRIIDDNLWGEANQKMNEQIGYLLRVKHNYLLVGKVKCGQCNYTTLSKRRYTSKTRSVNYYSCSSATSTGLQCDNGGFQSDVMDQYVYDNVIMTILTDQLRKNNSKKERKDAEDRIKYWEGSIEKLGREKKRSINLYKKGIIEETELDKDILRVEKEISNADSEINRIGIMLKNFSTPKSMTYDMMKKYYWESDFQTRKSLADEYVHKVVANKIEKIDFDITKHYSTRYEDSKDGKHINIMKNPNFRNRFKIEVVWYVEIFTFLREKPLKALMTSRTGTNFLSERLEFDKESRILSLEPSKYRVQAQ